ncbi:MAG: hypothetical protein E7399_08350 [Ruminococcaceae bacterium]|nr:hypothetical protein [Oscillospiraceae bacterium]
MMSLSFFYGTDRETLQMHCRQLAMKDGRTLLIVPEQFSLSGETSFLDLQRYNTEVTSFRRFAQEIFYQTGNSGEYIPGSAKLILMEQALQKCSSKLTVYKTSTDKKGFSDTMCKTVSELKHADIAPHTLLEKKEELNGHPYLQEKLTDMALIYRYFNELSEKVGRDADDDLTRLTDLLSQQNPSINLSDTTLILYYFNGFTVQERKLLSVLNGLCTNIYIGMVTESCHRTDETKLCFWSTIRNMEAFSSMNPEYSLIQGEKKNAELPFLAEQYFTYPSRKWEDNPKNITVFSAENPYYEAEMIASEIVRLCRQDGKRYRDFTIVARSLSEYEDVLEQAFRLFDIPYFTDQKESVACHPLVTFLMSVRDIFEYKWNYESVFHYVKSIFSPLSKEQGDVLENFALAYGVFGNVWTDDKKWTDKLNRVFMDEDCGFDRTEIENARNLLVYPLTLLWDKVKGGQTYCYQAENLFLFLESIQMYEKLTEKTELFFQNGEQQLSEEYRQLWNILLHVLDQVVNLAGEDKGTFSKFMDLLEEGFSASSVGSVPKSLDSVTITSADRFVGEGVKCLFVIGVNEGEFPASGEQYGLLDGTERDILEAFGLEMANGRQKSAYMEQEIIYKVISLAQEKIIFTYRKADMDQTAKAPSQIIGRLRELFPNLSEITCLPLVSSPGFTFSKMVESPSAYKQALEWFEAHPQWKLRLQMLERDGNRQRVTLSSETINQLYRNELKVSVSRLERFKRCPFSFHATYHLKAKERRQYQLGAPDTGSFLHDILERCACLIDQSASLSWQTITREECGILVDRIVEETVSQWFGGLLISSPRYFYLTARLKRLLSKNLYAISLHFKNGLFRPLGYELEFSDKGDFPPVTLRISDGKTVKLTGKIDRADVYRTPDGSWIRIIDYKSGPKELHLNDVYYGLNLQLITYLDAMCQEDEPAGVFYFNVTDPYTRTETALDGTELIDALRKNYKMKGLVLANNAILRAMDENCDGGSDLIPAYVKKNNEPGGSIATKEEFQLLRKQVKSCLKQLSAEIRQGKADVLPIKTKREYSCTYCPYSSVCGYENNTGQCKSFTDLTKEEIMNRLEDGEND